MVREAVSHTSHYVRSWLISGSVKPGFGGERLHKGEMTARTTTGLTLSLISVTARCLMPVHTDISLTDW